MTARRDTPGAGALLIGAWFGIVTGFVEVAVLLQQKYLPLARTPDKDRFLLVSRDVLWMAPLADAALIGAAALLARALTRRASPATSWRIVLAVCCFLSAFSLLCMRLPFGLSVWARLFLALGVGVQLSLLLSKRADGFRTLVRRSVVWLAAAVVLCGAGLQAWEMFRERRDSALAGPVIGARPDVLLIVLDTVRAQSLGLYGGPRPTTPQLERIARTAVVFDHAYATAPWTLPSHVSLFTGRFPHETSGDWWEPFAGEHPTIAETLRASGYSTAAFVSNTVFLSEEFGLQRGFSRFESYRKTPGQIVSSASLGRYFGCFLGMGLGCGLRPLIGFDDALGRKPADIVNRDFLSWLSGADADRPFFAFLNYMDAHHPYVPAPPFDTAFGPIPARRNPAELRDDWSADEARAELHAYESAIAGLDHDLGALIDELARLKRLDNLVVIITSDHGESFLEHNIVQHGNSLYMEQLHVPLLVVAPGTQGRGVRVKAPVTIRDIPATILELAGLADAVRFPGRSLSAHWTGAPAGSPFANAVLSETTGLRSEPRRFPVSRGDMQSLVNGTYHYIRNGDGVEELYDVERDPRELQNLAGERAEVMAAFREALRQARR